MEKSSAAKIISQTFQNPFNKDSFVYFIKSLLNHIEPAPFIYRGNFIPDAYKSYIKTLERIGKYQDKDDKKIDLLIVHLKKEKSLERARTMQRNFIAWYLNGSRGDILKDATLVAFVSPNLDDWRFSLVKMDYRLDASGEKVKVKQELTPARRFSFLVGKTESSHTAQSSLVPILQDDDSDPTLKELEDAFSIEKVTKEFFEKYRDLFLKVKEALDEIVKKDKRVGQDFKEKNIDTVNFAKKLLGQIVFLYFLQKKGWFGVERDKNWGTGPKNFLRLLFEKGIAKYDNFFNDILEPLFYEALAVERTDDFYSRFNCKIPFLNGGLFDPINNYDWIHTDILLASELFSNSTKTKQGDIGTGILDIFDRYNFTVKEDEPLEKEVAVDPEMLGKVFENLLEVKDRKSKGTYYTPREIVHYMCQQSLINYLKTETKVEEEKIERVVKQDVLLTKDEYLKWKKEKQKPKNKALALWEGEWEVLDKALENIRIVDPACGSGAFLVGMLQEIVRARKLLQLFNIQKESIYTMKEKSIKSSIYGVDIDPGAVEIAKLRLWLSLIVEEEDIKQIKPLPNLDYKIICGNSLLRVKRDLLNFPLFDKLEKLKPLFFYEANARKKQGHKRQIDELIKKITNGHKDFDFEIYFSEVFHEKKGFDVVIANPPYIDSEAMVSEQKDLREFISKTYTMTKGNWDIYIAFFELGFKILNTEGVLTFITPDKWISKSFGDELRKCTINNIFSIVRAGREIFESAKVDSIISFFSKKQSQKLKILDFKNGKFILKREINKELIKTPFALDYLFSNHLEILFKIDIIPNKLLDLGNCENACATSDAYKIKSLVKNSPNGFDRKNQLKIINTGTIGRYFSKWGKHEMTYLKHKYLYPVVDKQEFFDLFKNSYAKKSIQSKLIVKGLNLLDACLDLDGNTIPGKSTLIITSEDINKLKILLSIINCKLASFYIKERYPASSYNLGISFSKDMINNFPIPKISKTEQKPFINLVDKILAITKDDDYLQNKTKQKRVKEYEQKIDKMVYKLYSLTKEEIKTVEAQKI